MTVFQQILWGYELIYPEHWAHQPVQDADAFHEDMDLENESLEFGQLVVRGEWNWERKPIKPLWNQHIGLMAGMIGAKEVGSAPSKLGGTIGLEADIVLPKKDNRRLWTGILTHDFRVLHFIYGHAPQGNSRNV